MTNVFGLQGITRLYSEAANVPASIESTVSINELEELILRWSRGFHADELTVEEVQDRFASLDVNTTARAEPLRQRIIQAQRELDAIRWGMCAAGQRAEVGRIFSELERFLADSKTT